jgi:hypothetical protein
MVRELSREVDRLVGRLRAWSGSAWQASVRPGMSRAGRAVQLVADLADLGRRAGTGAPRGAAPPRLADHALADQVAVVAADLVRALEDPLTRPGDRTELARDAHAAVRAARADLDPPRFPRIRAGDG